jgi:beta-galactosidase
MIHQFKRHCRRWLLAALLLGGAWCVRATESTSMLFDSQWRFIRAEVPPAQLPEFDDRAWETVTLPHTAHTEALVTGQGARQWQGICWYRKTFDLPAETRDQEIILRFDGAMNAAEIWVNGQTAGKFMMFQNSPGPAKRTSSPSAWTTAITR